MSASDMNEFVYGLHYKIESIGVWATNLHETLGDHAGHIDHIRTRAATSFKLVETETDSLRAAAATAERDTRIVMQKVEENDVQFKASVEKMTAMIQGEISALKGSEQTMSSDIATLASRVDAKLTELQATMGDLRTALTSAGPALLLALHLAKRWRS